MGKIDCSLQKLKDAIPRSRSNAASARDIANVHDWYVRSVIEGLADLEVSLKNGTLMSFEANHQRFYWIEGEVQKSKWQTKKITGGAWELDNKPSRMTWDKFMERIPLGEENAIDREELRRGLTEDQVKHFLAQIRKEIDGTEKALRSKAMTRGKHVYWIEWRETTMEGLVQKIFGFEGVVEARIVVKKDGVKHTYEKE